MAWWAQVIKEVVGGVTSGVNIAAQKALSEQRVPGNQPLQPEAPPTVNPGAVQAIAGSLGGVGDAYDNFLAQSMDEDDLLRQQAQGQPDGLGYLEQFMNRRGTI
jgi:hypothetical protein